MIIVHHLDHSRSNRVLFLLEELGVTYDIKSYGRDAQTLLAPRELKQIHPLGKSPVVEDGVNRIAESGAIITYLIETYGQGRLQPKPGTVEWRNYQYFLHYAEGSLMPLLLMSLVFSRISKPPAPWLLRPVAKAIEMAVKKKLLDPQTRTHFDFIESELKHRPWFAGAEFSAADVQMSYPIEAAESRVGYDERPAIQDWLKRIRAKPSYQKAVARGGPASFNAGEI